MDVQDKLLGGDLSMPVHEDYNLETGHTWTVIKWLKSNVTDTDNRVSELEMVSIKI